MKIFSKFIRLLSLPFLNKLDLIYHYYYKFITTIFYKPNFKNIGPGSIIRNPMLLLNVEHICIGKNVFIRDHARIEIVKVCEKSNPHLVIGDNTNIEQNFHLTCHDYIEIGSNVSIAANCAIVDVTHPYNILDGRKIGDRILDKPGEVIIGDGTMIGFGSVILPNVTIGKFAVIGANSVVTKDIPDYCVAAGSPAKVLKNYYEEILIPNK